MTEAEDALSSLGVLVKKYPGVPLGQLIQGAVDQKMKKKNSDLHDLSTKQIKNAFAEHELRLNNIRLANNSRKVRIIIAKKTKVGGKI